MTVSQGASLTDADIALAEALEAIEAALLALDRRRHVLPARLEVSREKSRWIAQIMADPLKQPLAAGGVTPLDAICTLGEYLATRTKRSL